MEYREGSILSIKLIDFVTYKKLFFKPGTHLNMIIGPNGTGKSTIVSAIVIGLGGNVSVIGRSSQLINYIRQGCQKAEIQIELKNHGANSNPVVITRSFNQEGRNTFEIDGRKKNHKEVMELCKSFNIQVDNLCQFLPQDRVQDFAKMNAQALLLNTQKSVAYPESVSDLEKLIEMRNKQKDLMKVMDKWGGQVQDAKQRNDRIQNVIENIEQQKLLENDIIICKRRLLWIAYEKCREEFNQMKLERIQAKQLLNERKIAVEPLEQEIKKLKADFTKKTQGFDNASNRIKATIKKINDIFEDIDSSQMGIKREQTELDHKIKHAQTRETEIREMEDVMESTKLSMLNTVNEHGSREDIIIKENKLKDQLGKYTAKIEDLKSKQATLANKLNHSVKHEIRQCENQLNGLMDTTQRRLEILRKVSEDAHTGAMWLQKNKHIFRSPVYAPILVELNVKNSAHAKYIENVVPFRDLVGFICEDKQDMDLLNQKLRVEMKLKINVMASPAARLNEFQPKKPIEELQRYGFYAYLIDLVDGPEAILSYLCKMYRLHLIPVGTEATERMADEIPLNQFFTENSRISNSTSNYTGALSSSMSSVSEARMLNVTLDLQQLKTVQERLAKLTRASDDLKNNMSTIESARNNEEEKRNQINEQRRVLQSVKSNLDGLIGQYNRKMNQIEALRNENVDLDSEREQSKGRIRKILEKVCDYHVALCKIFQECKKHEAEHNLNMISVEAFSRLVSDKEAQSLELRQNLRESEIIVNRVEAAFERSKTLAKQRFEDAVKACNNKKANDKDFPDKDKFDKLPDTLDEINEKIDEFQARIDCLHVGDTEVYQQYKDRQDSIAKTTNEMKSAQKTINTLVSDMEEVRERWLSGLHSLVQKINENFGRYMSYMECAGEVSVSQDGNEHDYDQYGIRIKVRYRGCESMQELNQYTQSGGERAVATAVYMLSLQELSQVPFRCVDEINQGMDPVNERMVFELLVKATSMEHTPQYFLLTPKLLPDLSYSKYVTLHIVNNGQVDPDNSLLKMILKRNRNYRRNK